ncbi:High-affinity glucose transporter [Choanephora cucurbitarum]|uniref:High-affinity glucose transporter n=1 Tax=Choanephora cucurbitarum TaxID=101091 RepID=A0A1C7NS28_9FUNG|nr:High-affinity glucose transporter [Choanephora cucurbitarum]
MMIGLTNCTFPCSYNFGVLTGLLLVPSFVSDLDISTEAVGNALISTLMAGAFVGAIVSGPLADAIGRKALMAVGIIIFIFGNVLQVGAMNIKTMYGGRSVTGVSLGILSMVVPLYQSEIAPKNMRGRLMSIQQFAITLGTAFSYWMAYAFVDVPGSTGWRLTLGLQLIPAVICLLGLLIFIPQSPRHSIDKQYPTEALETLSKIRGDGTKTHTAVLMEFTEMKQNISFEHKLFKDHKYKRIFSNGPEHNLRRLLLGMAVQIFQQFTGVTALLVYAPQIFEAVGIKGRRASIIANALSGSINLLATIPAMVFIDRWGRRPTMITGAVLCSIFLCVMAILTSVYKYSFTSTGGLLLSADTTTANTGKNGNPLILLFDSSGSTVAFLIVTYLCVAFYSCTWGTLGWIYPTELYSQGVRAKALGISTASNWLFTYVVLQLTPIMLQNIYWRTYVLFSVACLIIAIIVHYEFPETNGKSLEEVDLIFSAKFNSFDTDVHHPQTAAAALAQMEKVQQKNKDIYQFPFTPEITSLTNHHTARIPFLTTKHYVVTTQANAHY